MSEINAARSILNARSENEHLDIVVRGDDTRPEFHSHGFCPEQKLKERIIESLARILDAAPAMSSLRFRVERIGVGIRTYMLLTHAGGCMFAMEQAQDPHRALQKVVNVIHLKIRKWKQERFHEQSENARRYEESRGSVSFREEGARGSEKGFSPSVLIVDDNPISTKLIESCLRQQGCTVTLATSGEEAVRKVTNQDFDLLVLDWQMPEMTGGEVLLCAQDIISYDSTFRLPWLTSLLPVVTYSGEDTGRMEIPNCENFDVVAHISKTASYPELTRATSGILNSGYLAGRLEELKMGWVEKARQTGVETLDLDRLKSFEEYDHAGASLLSSVLKLFLDLGPRSLSKMQAALAARDFSQVHKIAHELKSSSANVGARRVAKICESLERATRPDETRYDENVAKEVAGLERELALTLEEVRKVRGLVAELT